ncbi:MAG: ShlB/FhaC/HecB family hemolysin secretion/activation protein [Phenylobacterium sp.]|uniref:ShlB/FhaC/HecB family hemolysin secretion/activation protein n=1 Tax=Phenylobacterium sp. TaxID=1871053 RepID=UPI00121A02D3|nr:ShlB/FhaC/HecB family hemolysin secretion/activation protein [Phenylobacterium sp.]TAL28461.1 MAG: ShlB/FhaC/HecB family hemolysin secretion/activation protein [Phenylobacterium sp.]
MGVTVARLGAAATLAVAATPSLLHAQAVAPSRQELNPAARSERLPAPQADLFSNPDAGPCPLAENPAALTVTSVTLNGLESVSADELRPAYTAFLNKPGGDASDLCRIRDAVADALFARGILARVEIPAQTIDGGAVTLEVIEARIVNVSLRGDAGPAAPALEKYAAKLRGMTPFDIERVQRFILLASDVPGLKVRASVRPSSSGGRGAVDLDLNVERDEEELIVNVQNLQGKATGRWGALGRYDLNARTRYGERLTLVGYRTVFHNEQWVAQALSEARLGGDGWVVRGGLAYGESRPGGALSGLGLKSVSVVGNVEAAYPLVRKRRENVWAAAGFEYIDQDTRLSGGGKLINDDLRVFYARVDADQTTYFGYRPIVLRGNVGVRRGIEGFGATDEGDRLLSRAGAKTNAWTLLAEASAQAVITPKLQAYVEVSGQYANQPLTSYEEFSVGSLTVGRGYDPGYISGDKAIAASFELRAGPFQPSPKWTFSPYGFFDIAHTSDQDRGGFNQTVKSVGVGFQIPVRERWVLDVSYARPLDKRAFDRSKPPGRLLVNFTARFF